MQNTWERPADSIIYWIAALCGIQCSSDRRLTSTSCLFKEPYDIFVLLACLLEFVSHAKVFTCTVLLMLQRF